MKFANKIGAKFLIVLGDDEIEKGKAKLKDMADGSETEINLNEIVEDFGEAIRVQIFKNIAEII
jgi:histidyl-tRNA synthetase